MPTEKKQQDKEEKSKKASSAKKTKQKASKKKSEDSVKAPVLEEKKPVAKKKPAPTLLGLEEVARQHVENYKPHWLPSINSFAKSQGFQDPASKQECLDLLKKWGAKIK